MKKLYKKSLSLILAVIMALSSLSCLSFTAFATTIDDVSFKNPLYTGETIKGINPLKSSSTINSVPLKSNYSYNGTTYYADSTELYNKIRVQLAKRTSKFTIHYYTTSSLYGYGLSNALYDLYFNATEDSLSVSSVDGDYVRWSVCDLATDGCSLDKRSSSGYYYTITMVFSYYDTATQEKQTNNVVKSIVDYVRKQNWSDYKIAKYVHDYICSKTTYDYDAVKNGDDEKYNYAYSAYGALVKGKSVCQGYATAYYRIMKELGFSVRFVSSDPQIGCHAWNIVKLDNSYYFVDCTWDDEFGEEIEKGNDEYAEYSAYQYFLVDYDDLRKLDSRYNEHTLYDELYDNSYFENNYQNYFATSSYDVSDYLQLSNCSISLSSSKYTYNGNKLKPSITVKSANGDILVNNVDYKLTYSNNINSGRAKVKVIGLGDYKNMSSVRTYFIYPEKTKSLTLKTDSRKTTSLTLKWSATKSSATGYIVQCYKSGEWQTIATITSPSTTTYTVKNLSPSTNYKFRVCAYKNVSNVKRYGSYVSYTTCTIPKKPTNLKLSTSSRSITAKWSSVKCDGYQIQYSKNSSFKNAKSIKVSSSKHSKKIKSLSKSKKYYVRVRAYKTRTNSSGKTYYYYSQWTNKKSIVVK